MPFNLASFSNWIAIRSKDLSILPLVSPASTMMAIGEETGEIEEMLDKLADYYDEEVEVTTQTVLALLEPMIIVFMAIIVVILIAAIMGPMLSLYNGVGNM